MMRSALNAITVAALTKLPSTSAHASAAESLCGGGSRVRTAYASTIAGAGVHNCSPRSSRRSISAAAWE